MAMENIQYVYDHKRFYRTALRSCINGFLVTKRTTKRYKEKIQLKLARKRCRSLTAVFGPSKYVQLSLH